MNSYLLRSLFLLLLIQTNNLIAQTEEFFQYGTHFTKSKLDMRPLTAEEKLELENSNSRSDTIDILNYSIALDIRDYSGQTIVGSCEIRFTPLQENVDQIILDLQSLNIDSVYGSEGLLNFDYSDPKITIELGQSFNPGDTSSITVAYSGAPLTDPSGFGGIAFEDNIVFNLGIGLGSNPYNYGRGWFPCFDNFVERATYDIDLTSSNARIPFATGNLIEEEDLGAEGMRKKFRMDDPIPTYLVGFAAGNYAEVNLTHPGMQGDIPISLVAKPGDTTTMKNSFARLGAMIDALEFWFGPYEWDRVGFVLTPVGAMEHNTLIAYPDFVGLEGVTPRNDGLMAHELAHHWWGNMLTLSAPSNMWIKEGPAEYSSHLFTEYFFGRTDFVRQVRDNLELVLSTAHVDDGDFLPLSGLPYENTYGTHTYQKGAAMMHNLRGYLGDELFSSSMTAMLEFYKYQSINAEQFRDFLIDETGLDLNYYFDAWIFNPGYSNFEIESIEFTQNGSAYDVDLEVQQKLRAAPALHNNVPISISFFDADWNSHTENFVASDEFTSVQFTIPFESIFQTINDDQLLNLARLQDRKVVTSIGPASFRDVGINTFDVTALEDSTMINVVHHWVAPDPIQDPDLDIQISSTHYWTINGDFSGDFDAKITIRYDGREPYELDYDLVNETEEDLILLYREGPGEDWIEYPFYNKVPLSLTDGFGFIRFNNTLPGEYAFANGSFPVSTHEPEALVDFQVFPNPASTSVQIQGEIEDAKRLNIRLLDAMGRMLKTEELEVQQQVFRKELNIDNLPKGIYSLQLFDPQRGQIGSQKIMIQ